MDERNSGPADRRSRRAARWVAVIILCLLPAGIALAYIHAYGVNCVFSDSYTPRIFEDYYNGALTFHDFYVPDNEHRLLSPRLVMFPLGLATRYNSVAEMYLGWGFICLSAVPVFLLCRRMYPDRLTAATAFVPAAWILFSLGQTENLLMGVGMAFFMGIAFLLLSMHFMQKARGVDGWMIASAAAGVVASFCFSNLLLLWPIGLAMILLNKPSGETGLRKSRAPALLLWSLIGTSVWLAYFAHWHKVAAHPIWSFGLHNPWMFARYFCNYVSSPLGPGKDGRIMLLLIYLGGAVLVCWRWKRGNTLSTMPLAMILFVFGTALATTVARAGFGSHQALMSRYQTFSNLGLIGLYLLCLPLLPEVHFTIAKRDATKVLGGALLFLLVIRPMYVQAYAEGEPTFTARTLCAYRLRTAPMQSDRLLGGFLEDARFVRHLYDLLGRLKFNVFAAPPAPLPAGMRQVDEKDLPHVVENFMGRTDPKDFQTVVIAKEMDSVSVIGHAHDNTARAPAGGVFIEVDGGAMNVPAAYGLPRPEVAIDSGVPGYRYSGFEADFATSLLKPGRHVLKVKVISADRKSCALSADAIVVEIPEPAPSPVETK